MPYQEPTVSVAMIAFNHERFIAQAIQGVLNQKTNFAVELVIGDDCSTDSTRQICEEYQQKHPAIVRLLHREHNLGMQRNFMETVKACRGKYVALCEGDDYWTDPNKLQEQVDFLDAHEDFAICHHKLEIVDESQPGKRTVEPSGSVESITTFENLARKQHILTASCVFRNNLFEFPEEFFLSVFGTDYALNLLNSFHGKIKFIDKAMGVYRVHGGGEWSGRPKIDRSTRAVDTILRCAEYFAPRAAEEFDFHCRLMSCFLEFEKGEFDRFRASRKELLNRHSRFLEMRTRLALLARYILSWFPFLIDSYSGLSGRLRRF